MIGQALKQWFWDCYDCLGRLLVLNLGLGILFVTAALLGLGVLAAVAPALSPQATFLLLAAAMMLVGAPMAGLWLAGMLEFGRLSTEKNDPPLRSFLGGMRAHGLRMVGLVGLATAIIVVLLANIFYYAVIGGLEGALSDVGGLLSGLSFWGILLVLGSLLHAAPLAVRRRMGARAALKLGFFLVLRHPMLTLGVLLFLGSLWVIGAVMRMVGLVIFGFSFPVMLVNSVHDVVWERINARQPAPSAAPVAASWHEVRAQEEEAERQRLDAARYDRTFRDILKPWEMN